MRNGLKKLFAIIVSIAFVVATLAIVVAGVILVLQGLSIGSAWMLEVSNSFVATFKGHVPYTIAIIVLVQICNEVVNFIRRKLAAKAAKKAN